MTTTEPKPLTLRKIRGIFARNHGSARALAVELGISSVTVSKWMHGTVTSKRIADAAQIRALELLAEGEVMENHDIEEPERSPQYPPYPCPGCGALELEDCQCPSHSLDVIDQLIAEAEGK